MLETKRIDRASQIYSEALEQLRISELLLEEAIAKQQREEIMESLELRSEALAYEYEGLQMLDEAVAEHRKSFKRKMAAAGGRIES